MTHTQCHIADIPTFIKEILMAAPSIAAEIVENIASHLLDDVSVSDVCRKFKISRPTVTAIKKGDHKCLSAVTRKKLVGSQTTAVVREKTPRNKKIRNAESSCPRDNSIRLAQENLRLRNLLYEVIEKVNSTVKDIGSYQACA